MRVDFFVIIFEMACAVRLRGLLVGLPGHFTASEIQTGAIPHLLEVRKHALFAPQFGMILICKAFVSANLECVFI